MSSLDVGLSASGSALGAQDSRPLTEQEFQLLQRLLADPFSFPLQFKTWLVAYLSASDLTLPMGAILGLTSLLGITGAGEGTLGLLPAGIVLPYGGAIAPTGSLLCDGASYLKTDHQRLSDAIGTTYGSVDSLHFNVPDIQGRMIVGVGTNPDVSALNKTEGIAKIFRRPKHRHTPHAHTTNAEHYTGVFAAGPGGTNTVSQVGIATVNAADGGSGNVNDSLDAPAYITLNFIIIE